MRRRWLGWVLIGATVLACGSPDLDPAATLSSDVEPPPDGSAVEAGSEHDAALDPDPGSLPVTHGTRAAIRDLRLRVEAAGRNDAELVLALHFENRSATSFALAGDLSGEQARLRDGDGRFHAPVAVDTRLQPVEPDGGFRPGASSRGRLAFAGVEPPLWLEVPGFDPLELDLERLPVLSPRDTATRDRDLLNRDLSNRDPHDPDRVAKDETRADLAQELEALLTRQATALTDYDIAAYRDTFTVDGWEIERNVVDLLRNVPLRHVSLEIRKDRRRRARVRQRGDVAAAEVELRFTLDGFVDNIFPHDLRFAFKRREDRWLVAGIEDDARRPVFFRRPSFVARHSNHFLIYGDANVGAQLGDIAADAEVAYATLQREGLPLEPRYLILVLGDRRAFAHLAGRPDAAGLAVARYAFEAGEVINEGRVFYINGELFDPRGRWRVEPRQRRITVAHELVHLALASEARPWTPTWLQEGIAVWASGDVDDAGNRRLVKSGSLEALDLERLSARALGVHGGAGVVNEYRYAGLAVAYLVEHGGSQRLLDFYRGFAAVPTARVIAMLDARGHEEDVLEVGTPIKMRLTEELLQDRYGATVAELSRDVEAWLVDRWGM